MKLKIDLTKEYGVVLEGGGAKGAYQIGAWRALKEVGVKIKGIAGVSVGALNGALICMNDLELAANLWENISYSKVMDVKDDIIQEVLKGTVKKENIAYVIKEAIKVITEGGIDISPLKKLIEETISEEILRLSPIDLYIITYSVTDHKLLDLNIKETPDGLIADMLLASAYFLAFKNQKLHGKAYMDGGGWNNVPIGSLIDRDYKDIIVLRIYGLGQERRVDIPDGITIYNIAPRQNLGKTLEFDKKKSRKNMILGYFDAKRTLYGLEGRHYYLDLPDQESYYFHRLTMLGEQFMAYSEGVDPVNEKEELTKYRRIYEVIIPQIAKNLELKADWTYKELYIAMLEDTAKGLRVNRINIYTERELLNEIARKAESYREDLKELPIYLDILDRIPVL